MSDEKREERTDEDRETLQLLEWALSGQGYLSNEALLDRVRALMAERDEALAKLAEVASERDWLRAAYEALPSMRAVAVLHAVEALCDAADEASLRPDVPDFEPIEVPWTVAVRAILAASPSEVPS